CHARSGSAGPGGASRVRAHPHDPGLGRSAALHDSLGGRAGRGRRIGAGRPYGVDAACPTLADDGSARPSTSPLPSPATVSMTRPVKDISLLRARRREARRRRRLARLDFGLGLLLAVVVLTLAPGIAIAALVALLALLVCVLSVVLERRRSRRRRVGPRAPRDTNPTTRSSTRTSRRTPVNRSSAMGRSRATRERDRSA